MAILAFTAELAIVPVFMAGETGGSETEISATRIFDEYSLAGGGREACGIVAAVALESGVAAFERVAGFAVVEFFETDIPADGHELLAVVLGMAFGALIVALRTGHEQGVESLFGGQALADFGVAAGALEFMIAAAAADVAADALRRPIEFGVSFGEVAGREL